MSKKICFLIHGFNVKDRGERTTGRLVPYFENEGYKVIELSYGWTHYLSVKWENRELSDKLKNLIAKYKAMDYHVTVVGHSNGCTIAHLAMEQQKVTKLHPDTLIYINPALKRDLAPGEGVRYAYVLHSYNDRPVKIAMILSRILPNILEIGRPWGAMGAYGYQGDDERVVNILESNLYLKLSGEMKVFKHSTIFEEDVLPLMGAYIAKL